MATLGSTLFFKYTDEKARDFRDYQQSNLIEFCHLIAFWKKDEKKTVGILTENGIFRLIWEVTSREEDKDSSLQSEATQPTLMYARWMSSPADANTESGSSTDAILFVEDYNIFYIPDVGIEEKRIFPLSQTEVVKPEVIFHGIPDWIYEGIYYAPKIVGCYLGNRPIYDFRFYHSETAIWYPNFWYMFQVSAFMRHFSPLPSPVWCKVPLLRITEDILKRDQAIWVSPDGTKIVYATFNDSQVQNVQWKIYGDGRDASVNPYPKEAYMRYPKVSIRVLSCICCF